METSASVAPLSALPGISPSRGENDSWRRLVPLNVAIVSSGCFHLISPLEGEMSGRTEGGETTSTHALTSTPNDPATAEYHLG
jgi:hypothetical protein